ncbi:beta-lactamase family protein [Mucilaginibacter sp. Bleaf8]|uniref:serine hydrolase domain-containing protein n=1 Tax=Mucilaginibacter sp. Bleaf8 TaxID=2834430 RepID=UPI001BCBAC6D|nr:serine hydrolase domain-containing protein [Mucilaginibacter sp. Bleaf8]MBS7565810.1 beta-lactamase family protein [Mucilaginibacter sp. Bleaf8]
MYKLILILLLMLACGSVPAQNINKQNTVAENFIRATVDSLHIPGLAVAIVKNGKILKLSAYGKANLDWQQPVSAHTNFQIASTSKLLATTLAMKSIYNNKLHLDDEVSRYIDSVPAAWQGLKVRHLFNHTSGIKVFKQNRYAPLSQVIKALKDSALAFPYGTRQTYASGDYTVLLYIYEKIYNKPYPQIVKDEITGPMHMADGAFDRERLVSDWMETDVVPQKATTYYVKDGQLTPYKFFYPQYTYTAGGYFASITDMANWAVAMDKQVLFPAAVEMQYAYAQDTVNGKLSDFSRIGWGVGKPKGILIGGHSGGPALGDVVRIPQAGVTVIVLSNDGELLPYFANAIATFYVDGLPFKRRVPKFKRTQALQ